jgi:NitT/TauT family transport system ATP-binding protein
MKGRIEIDRLGVRFASGSGDVEALRDVSMMVEPGSFVSIIGPSGCGKSTLLNVVAGFVQPTAGSVLIDGATIDGPSAERGVVFQQYSLFPWRTVRGNVEFGLKMKGIAKPERQAQARTLLGLAGLLGFENHYPDALSGGMKQRGPQMLLMDEPFGALDAQTRSVMQQILTNMWQRLRITVLFITHDIDEAIFLSDRIHVMTARPGELKAAIDVPLPRPRTPEMVTSAGFMDLRASLIRLVREESLKAMGGELADGALDGIGIEIGPEGMGRML